MKVRLYTPHGYDFCTRRLKGAAGIPGFFSWQHLSGYGEKPVDGWIMGSRFEMSKRSLWSRNRGSPPVFAGRVRRDTQRGGCWIEGWFGIGRLRASWMITMLIFVLFFCIPEIDNSRIWGSAVDLTALALLALVLVFIGWVAVLAPGWVFRRNREFLLGFLKRTLDASEQPKVKRI